MCSETTSATIMQMTSTTNKHYYPAIDGLRAIAVLIIIFFHLDIKLFAGGFVGVDVFFVISGYLITRNIYLDIIDDNFSFKHFYYSRVRRLFPAMVATVAITLLFCVALFSPLHLSQSADSSIAALLSVANIYFWNISGYFDTDAHLKPFLHFWSLSVEEQFYLVWPASLVLLLYITKKPKVIIASILIIGFISLSLAENKAQNDPDYAFYWVHLRICEFMCGAMLLWFEPYINKKKQVELFFTVLGLLLISFAAFKFTKDTAFPGINALVPCFGASLIILGKNNFLASLLLANPLAKFIGKISYSLYLVHWPIWVLYSYWAFHTVSSLEKLALFLLVIITGTILYKIIEKPFRLNQKNKKNVKLFFLGLISIYFILIAIALDISKKEGWEWRFKSTDKTKIHGAIKCINTNETHGKKPEKKCSLGELKDYKKEILLIGDSHAAHLRKSLGQFGKKHHIKINAWTFPRCPPVWNTYMLYGLNNARPLRQQRCKEIVSEWQRKINHSKFDAVILASRWMSFYEDIVYSQHRRPFARFLLVDKDEPIIDVEESRHLFETRLKRTAENIINTTGAKVIVFSQVPLLGKNIEDCDQLPSWLYSSEQLQTRCNSGVSYSKMMARLQFTDETIRGLKQDNILPIIPSDHFCNHIEKQCYTMINKQVLYRDDNHLNIHGANFLMNSIEQELITFLEIGTSLE